MMETSRPLRRLVAALVFLACLLAPQVLVSAADRSPRLDGEAGSGPPAWRSPLAPRATGIRWSDVPRTSWARNAIDYVAGTNDWMRDFAQDPDETYPFKPDALETRRLFARSVVLAFAPDALPDPELSFPDLPSEDRSFASANVAVSSGWLETDADGNFLPDEPVTMRDVHRALVLALGLGDLSAGADALHLRNGTEVPTPPDFGTTLIGMKVGLRYNHGDETLDVTSPDAALPRAEVAWSLYRAATMPTWVPAYLAPYADMQLPNLSPKMLRVVEFGVRYVGYPYVWGGEWAATGPSGYCCGYQPIGGFDCSGITWWVMRQASDGWDNTPPREYRGWALPQRSSAQMAAVGGRVAWDDLKAGDLMFYDGDGDGTVDHVDTYVGNGWSIDSGSSNGGVTLTYVSGNWYQDHFVKGRRILG
jgi:hypothetical protein